MKEFLTPEVVSVWAIDFEEGRSVFEEVLGQEGKAKSGFFGNNQDS